jgi:hypothetical protein
MQKDNYRDKIEVMLINGTMVSLEKWQKIYGLTGTKIGKYFSYMEPRFRKDIEDFGKLVVCEPLMRVMDDYREYIDEPVNVNSFNRSDAKQKELKRLGFKTATFSPHVALMGVDLDTYNRGQTLNNVHSLKIVARRLGIKIRVGYKSYLNIGQTFIHLDVCPEYFAPGAVFHDKDHPWQWEKEMEW